jgi:hypothetical protein
VINHRLHNRLRAAVVAVFGLAALFSPLGIGGGFGAHFASAAPLNSMPPVSVTVPAGGSATLEVQGFAFQPGANLPEGPLSLAQQPFPSDKIRTALYYGVSWGYAQTKPQQVALAIWWAQDGTWLSDDRTIAESIASAAANAPGLPSLNTDGRPIPALVEQGRLLVSELSLTPGALSPSSGSGTLVLQNTGNQDVVVNLPYGTLFTGESGSAIVWSVGQGQPPAQATPTVAASGSTSGNGNIPQSNSAPVVKASATSAPSKEDTSSPTSPSTHIDAPSPSNPSENAPTTQDTSKAGQAQSNTASAGQINGSQKQGAGNTPTQQQSDKSLTGSDQAPGNAAPESNSAANGPSAPPLPLGGTPTPTVAGGAASPPLPEATSQTGINQAPPAPDLTKEATLTVGELKPTPTEPPKLVPTEPPQAKPTPVPTKLPEPPPGPIVVPTISTGSDNGNSNNQVIQPLPGEGSPPTSPPTTGGGPSPGPIWLTLLSTIMVLGGWTLRRMSNLNSQSAVAKAPVESNE